VAQELLKVEGLVKYFPAKGGMFYSESGLLESGSKVHAVDGVTFALEQNSTLGIVGESGCGKTTLVRTILLLSRPTAGRIILEGTDLTDMPYGELAKVRPNMQMVFQDPFSSLDPRMRAKQIVAEPLKVVTRKKDEVNERVRTVFDQVGLNPEQLNRYPNEFSGGQRQRIAIARALSTKPKLVFLDEPTSALDASTQAQILNLLKNVQREYKISYIFISHNVNVVRHMCDRIAVMYLGKIVELGESVGIIRRPRHPYTSALILSVPMPNPRLRSEVVEIRGETPSPVNPPSGCRYHPRCPYAKEDCQQVEPQLVEIEDKRYVACWHPLKKLAT
jgi:oligopeptide/dipeptide ABC transporter ATP-binding protein